MGPGALGVTTNGPEWAVSLATKVLPKHFPGGTKLQFRASDKSDLFSKFSYEIKQFLDVLR